ncbi:MAG: Lrp/AsnC family transcriptional regulator [Pseudorhodobacter sp.]|nr:MAG: Lrp/AsnC family transcriptional regulator [Pseudorhodobacter sp.]
MDAIDRRLLDEFQRDLPLVARPYAALGVHLGISESRVIDRLTRLMADGKVARVGATVRPNTAGASTLAAMAVPEHRIDEVAALVGAEPGVNHSYLREDHWNLWFVATASGPASLAASLGRIEAVSGLPVLDLALKRAFNIDLGFRLNAAPRPMTADRGAVDIALSDKDRMLLHALSQGLALVPHPFAALGPEEAVLDRIATLSRARIITRLGVIVRHRALGYTANAMVVWDIAPDRTLAAGRALAAHPGITLCYERATVPGIWPFALYSMIHATSRPAALQVLDAARALPELQGAVAKPLFSTRCFKQTGARIVEAA